VALSGAKRELNRNKIVTSRGEDARAELRRQRASRLKSTPEDEEQDHAARARSMRRTEDDGGDEHGPQPRDAEPSDELALQVTAKDDLLDQNRRSCQSNAQAANLSSVGGPSLPVRATLQAARIWEERGLFKNVRRREFAGVRCASAASTPDRQC